ncbi:MAG TPA: DHH family phosphoesterase, partial [Anaerolineaceae bacterium]|nr:DHH family phosphoesterase [Anaerolineaceae bacterium]
MHVILTHEQADFDALASLLAAGLLNSQAVAVLPRRMNRNARSFMNLYGADLPFVDARDLPPGPVERVTLVDTQSLVTLKGFTDATEVHVIDHHPKREDLNPDWQVVIEKVGATTTFLVELLREHNGHLTALQATLLLL